MRDKKPLPEILYVALAVNRWDGCEANGQAIQMSDDSVGFLPVFADLAALRREYPKTDWRAMNIQRKENK